MPSAGRGTAVNTSAVELLNAVRSILLRELEKPLTQKEIAELLGVPPQASLDVAEGSCGARSFDEDETASALRR